MPKEAVKKEEEIKVGGYKLTEIKCPNGILQEGNFTCNAGQFHIEIDKIGCISVYGSSQLGLGKTKTIEWRADYGDSSFTFYKNEESKYALLNEFQVESGEPRFYIFGTSIVKALENSGIKLSKMGFKTSNPYGNMGELKRFASLIAANRGSLKQLNVEGILHNFKETIDYETAIWAAATLADDVKELKEHPDVKKFFEERAKLPQIR
jgi:hypothetical protein